MYEFAETKIPGVFIITNRIAEDSRGIFVKYFNYTLFKEKGLNTIWKESFASVSVKNVIRGMHFQLPPCQHDKLVTVLRGSILDVVLDLRKDSPTYKSFVSILLNEKEKKSVYIPKGCAHGFKSLEDKTITLYYVGSEYHPKYDSGVDAFSFGFDWQCNNPTCSERDRHFESVEEFCRKEIDWNE